MYSVKLDENNYYTNSYAIIGRIDGGVDLEALPPTEDPSKACCYQWETRQVEEVVNIPVIDETTGLQKINETTGEPEFIQETITKSVSDWFFDEAKYQTVVEQVLTDEKAAKIKEIGATCKATIYAGVDVLLSDGETYHFSLNADDQTNIDSLFGQAASGTAEAFPYHADGYLCKMFPAADIIALGTAAMGHKIYNTTLCNYLNMYIRSLTDRDLIKAVTYSQESLSEEYKNLFFEFMAPLTSASN